jgi:hypothetical protein
MSLEAMAMSQEMKIKQQPKKPYAAPKLTTYGDLRALTRSGTGSAQEPTNQGQGSPQKYP